MNATEVRRPITVWLAVVASLLAFAVGQYLMHIRTAQITSILPSTMVMLIFAFSFMMLTTLLYFVFRGYNWARIAILAVVFLRSIFALNRFSHASPYINENIEIARVVFEVLSVCLLFTPPSNRWFKRFQQQA